MNVSMGDTSAIALRCHSIRQFFACLQWDSSHSGCVNYHHIISYVQYDHTHSVILPSQRTDSTECRGKVRRDQRSQKCSKCQEFCQISFGFFDTLIVRVKGDCSQVRLTSRLPFAGSGAEECHRASPCRLGVTLCSFFLIDSTQ